MKLNEKIGSIISWLGYFYLIASGLLSVAIFLPLTHEIIYTGAMFKGIISFYLSSIIAIPLGIFLYFVGKKIKSGFFLENRTSLKMTVIDLSLSVALIIFGIPQFILTVTSMQFSGIVWLLSSTISISILMGIGIFLMVLRQKGSNKLIVLLFGVGLLIFEVINFPHITIMQMTICEVILYCLFPVFLVSHSRFSKGIR